MLFVWKETRAMSLEEMIDESMAGSAANERTHAPSPGAADLTPKVPTGAPLADSSWSVSLPNPVLTTRQVRQAVYAGALCHAICVERP